MIFALHFGISGIFVVCVKIFWTFRGGKDIMDRTGTPVRKVMPIGQISYIPSPCAAGAMLVRLGLHPASHDDVFQAELCRHGHSLADFDGRPML